MERIPRVLQDTAKEDSGILEDRFEGLMHDNKEVVEERRKLTELQRVVRREAIPLFYLMINNHAALTAIDLDHRVNRVMLVKIYKVIEPDIGLKEAKDTVEMMLRRYNLNW